MAVVAVAVSMPLTGTLCIIEQLVPLDMLTDSSTSVMQCTLLPVSLMKGICMGVHLDIRQL